MSNAKKNGNSKAEEEKAEIIKKKERYIDYQQRIAPLKMEIINLGERNMENTVKVIRRWLKDDMRIINQFVVDKYGKKDS